MILFCYKNFCGTLVICNPNLQTLITFYKNARVNKSIIERNRISSKSKQFEKGLKPAQGEAHLSPAQPPLSSSSPNSSHLPPTAATAAPLTPPRRTPWTPPFLHAPPPPLAIPRERSSRARRRHDRAHSRPVSSLALAA